MKKVLIIFALLICSSEVYGISELEKAYKEKLESINKDLSMGITLDKKLNKIQSDMAMMNLETCPKTGAYDACEMEIQELNRVQSEYSKIKKKEDDLLYQKQDLKIKILEKYEQFPSWWTEAEKHFEKELKKYSEGL